MKGIAGYVVGALIFALLGAAALVAARFERDMAEAQEQIATLRYEEAAEKLTDAERQAAYAQWVPGVSERVQRELTAREAALKYWQQQYDAVLPRESDPVGAVDAGNIDLQLVVANAAFRMGQTLAKDRETTQQALDEAVANYLAVLKNQDWNEDAAFNYEYTVRLRDEFQKTRRPLPPPPEQSSANGQAGAPQETGDAKKFEVYIPLENTERTKAAEAGKAAPRQRKG